MNDDLLSELEQDSHQLPTDEKLQKIQALVKQMVSLERQVQLFEELLGETKKLLHKVSDFDIPSAMDEAGASSFTTDSGINVSVKQVYNGKITEENKEECFHWLEETGNSGLIKHNVEVKLGRSEHELALKIAGFLSGLGVEYTDKESVHWATLNSFIKEQITKGEDFPTELFNVYIGRTTKLKRT